MTAGVRLIADIAEIDRLILCRNHTASDGLSAGILHTSEVYRWDRSPGAKTESTEPLINIPYKQLIPDWEAYFSDAKNINSSSKLLFEKANTAIQSFGVLTAAVLPIHINNAFWGFALFGNTEKERSFNDDIVEMLRSAAFLFANALIRADMERDVKEALNKEMKANKAKSDFLSSMSHEIRTPMNAILGITEIQLENENISLDIQEAMKKIFNSGYLLLGIINDILDLSKIEAGKLELSPSNYDVPKLIDDTVQLIVMRYGKKPIDFNFQVDENIPLTLFGDELRIKQILNNLLSNAFKYTDKGEISMSVTAEDIRQGENPQITLVFRVADTGQGMTAEQIETLFDDYTRFNLEANRTIEGTGLGMSITKHLVNMMNGDIFVESEPEKGSVFTVRLPQRIVDSRVLGRELAKNIKQFNAGKVSQTNNTPQFVREYMPYGKVLVVDDVETNLYVARGLMTPYGLSIEVVTSGSEAVEKIKNGATYDIIFMDHFMPQMDGIETTKILRDFGYTRPIIALTANAIIGQAEMFLKNGFDGFISKPIDIRQLNASLNKFIRDKYPPEVVETARQQAIKINQAKSSAEKVQSSSGQELSAIFTKDAEKAIAILRTIISNAFRRGDDFRQYVINVHAMKSALANIGENELSATALKLEWAGRAENVSVIKDETPAFLEALGEIIEKNRPKGNESEAITDDSGNRAYLAERLHVIRTACEKYDETTANKALSELKQKKWPSTTNDLLDTIEEDLLHSDFEEAAKLIEDYEAIMTNATSKLNKKNS